MLPKLRVLSAISLSHVQGHFNSFRNRIPSAEHTFSQSQPNLSLYAMSTHLVEKALPYRRRSSSLKSFHDRSSSDELPKASSRLCMSLFKLDEAATSTRHSHPSSNLKLSSSNHPFGADFATSHPIPINYLSRSFFPAFQSQVLRLGCLGMQ